MPNKFRHYLTLIYHNQFHKSTILARAAIFRHKWAKNKATAKAAALLLKIFNFPKV